MGLNYLLSYPRSGNTVIRYCLEKITKKRTTDCGERYDFISKEELLDDVILNKEHGPGKIDINKTDKLIILIRNYKDVFISHKFRSKKIDNPNFIFETIRQDSDFISGYYDILNFYDNFNKEKMLVYYEDIIENLHSVMKRIINFLEPNNNYSFTEEDIIKWKEESKKDYRIKQGIKSKSIKNLFTILSKSQNTEIDNIFKSKNKYLFDKYLKKYQNQEDFEFGIKIKKKN